MSKPQGILRPLGLALVLAVGFAAAFALVVGWANAIWEGLHRGGVYESLVVRVDGTPLIERYTTPAYFVNFYALDGSEVSDPKAGWLQGASLQMPRREPFMFPLEGDARIGRFSDGQKPPNLWYFVHNGARDGRGYFVGYNGKSKLCLGFIGRDGFRQDQPPVEQWFPVDGAKMASGTAFSRYAGRGFGYDNRFDLEFHEWKVYMISTAGLLEIDLRKGSVATRLESTDLVAARILETFSKRKAAGEETPGALRHGKLAVRTADRVVLLDAAGRQHAAFLIPEELRKRDFIFYDVGSGTALLTVSRVLPDHGLRDELLWIDASGRVLRRAEIRLHEGNGRDGRSAAWELALAFPCPVMLAFMEAVAEPSSDMANGSEASYSTALARRLAERWPALLAVSLLSAALAWHCRRTNRRFRQPYSGVWFAFVLLTGVPGLVAYLFHRRWPVLEKCPTCGHDVPRDREACAKCGAASPPPEPKGCEVFA